MSEEITSEEEFHERIRATVNGAAANGVDVEGSWPVLNDDPDTPDWDLEIVALADTDG